MKLESATTYESVVGNRLLLKSDPKKGFAAEKEAILQDESIRKMFREICKQKFPDCDAAVNTVYNITAKKIVHARYAIQFRRFKEKAVKMKNKIALRNHLKVAAAHLNGQAKNNQGKAAAGLVGRKRAAIRVFRQKNIKKEGSRRLTTTHVGRIEDGEEKGGERSLTGDD